MVSPKGLTVKLKPIIRDKSVRNPKPRYNIFPHESLYILILNICQGFSLYPFGKIIGSNKKIPLIPRCLKGMTQQCPALTVRKAKGYLMDLELSLVSGYWEHIFNTGHIFSHTLGRISACLATSSLVLKLYGQGIYPRMTTTNFLM